MISAKTTAGPGPGRAKPQEQLVTILIANYNYAHFLPQAIDSALNQTYKKTEIIVVDDGSTDNSRAVIRGYGDRIRPIFKDNGGHASAINAGFAASQGEIVCLLDADDVWFPQKVERVVGEFSQHPSATVVFHRVQNVDRQGEPINRPWPHVVVKGNIARKVARCGGWWPWPPTSGLSFSRHFLNRVMEIPREYQTFPDPYLADLAPFLGEVVGMPQPLSLMRLHGDNHWSVAEGYERRAAHCHEVRGRELNKTLSRLGIDARVDLSKNLAYRSTKAKLGEEDNILALSWLLLINPYDRRIHSRLKAALMAMIRHRQALNRRLLQWPTQ